MGWYLVPVFHQLACKPSFHCQCSFDTINCHSKLNINTLYVSQLDWLYTHTIEGKKKKRKNNLMPWLHVYVQQNIILSEAISWPKHCTITWPSACRQKARSTPSVRSTGKSFLHKEIISLMSESHPEDENCCKRIICLILFKTVEASKDVFSEPGLRRKLRENVIDRKIYISSCL